MMNMHLMPVDELLALHCQSLQDIATVVVWVVLMSDDNIEHFADS